MFPWQNFSSFCGVPAAQKFVDYYLWEALLNERGEGVKGIVELGTWQGGFSLYLAEQAKRRGLAFRTYDVVPPERDIPGFLQCDIFASAGEVQEYLSGTDPVFLLVDGGNKPREAATFSPYLSSKSTIVVHDWLTEFFPKDVPDCLEIIFGDFCNNIRSMSRVFQVKESHEGQRS